MHRDIEFELTDAQFRKALRRFWYRAFLRRGLLVYAVILLALVLLMGADPPTTLLAVLSALAAVGIFAQVYAYAKFMRTCLADRRRVDDHRVHYHFHPQGVRVRSDLGSSDLSWRAFEKAWKYPDMWLLFVGRHRFLILPTASLDEELARFIERCVSLGPAARLCSQCGYDVRGQNAPRCPECGTSLEEQQLVIARPEPADPCRGDGFRRPPSGARLYLAGPMSGYAEHNLPAFDEAAQRLRRLGYDVFNPGDGVNLNDRQVRAYYMRRDVAAILESGAIVLLPGWRRSRGANLEVWLALDLDLGIYEYQHRDGEVILHPLQDLEPFELPFGAIEPQMLSQSPNHA